MVQIRHPGLWLNPLAVFLLCLAAYVFTLPRSITLEDAGLFQMVCNLGGISHPPGYPLFTLMCQPFVQLPVFGNSVFAGNFLNALFASTAVALFHHIGFRLVNRRFAWVAALGFGLSTTYWSQAIIIEVYVLAVLLFLICLSAALKYMQTGEIKYWYALGLCFGLALSNHWPLTVVSTPALLLLVSTRYQQLKSQFVRPQFWMFSIASLLLGLSPYLSLITDPDPRIGVYGGIRSIEQFFNYITRAAYSDNFAYADLADKLNYALWLLKQSLMQMGFWAAPIILIGLWLSFRKFPLIIGSSLLLLYLGSTYFLLALLNFDFEPFRQAIFKPYPVIAYLSVAAWFALGIEEISTRLEKIGSGGPWATVIPIISIVLIAFSNFNENNRRLDSFSETYAKTVLESLPANSILFVNGDFESGPFGYLNLVEGIRTDVEIRDWENLVFDNRLTSPFLPKEMIDSAALEFILSTNRPVFSLSNRLRPAINYGAYYGLTSPGNVGYAINPTMDKYLQHLIYLFNNHLVNDAHEQYLAIDLLIKYSRLYMRYAGQSSANESEVEARVLELQSTFPGRLITMENALREKTSDPQILLQALELAALAENEIPSMASNKILAVFYEYYGRLLSQDQSKLSEAVAYLKKSVSTYPASENTAICHLRQLVKQQKLDHPKILKQFDLDECEEQKIGIPDQ